MDEERRYIWVYEAGFVQVAEVRKEMRKVGRWRIVRRFRRIRKWISNRRRNRVVEFERLYESIRSLFERLYEYIRLLLESMRLLYKHIRSLPERLYKYIRSLPERLYKYIRSLPERLYKYIRLLFKRSYKHTRLLFKRSYKHTRLLFKRSYKHTRLLFKRSYKHTRLLFERSYIYMRFLSKYIEFLPERLYIYTRFLSKYIEFLPKRLYIYTRFLPERSYIYMRLLPERLYIYTRFLSKYIELLPKRLYIYTRFLPKRLYIHTRFLYKRSYIYIRFLSERSYHHLINLVVPISVYYHESMLRRREKRRKFLLRIGKRKFLFRIRKFLFRIRKFLFRIRKFLFRIRKFLFRMRKFLFRMRIFLRLRRRKERFFKRNRYFKVLRDALDEDLYHLKHIHLYFLHYFNSVILFKKFLIIVYIIIIVTSPPLGIPAALWFLYRTLIKYIFLILNAIIIDFFIDFFQYHKRIRISPFDPRLLGFSWYHKHHKKVIYGDKKLRLSVTITISNHIITKYYLRLSRMLKNILFSYFYKYFCLLFINIVLERLFTIRGLLRIVDTMLYHVVWIFLVLIPRYIRRIYYRMEQLPYSYSHWRYYTFANYKYFWKNLIYGIDKKWEARYAAYLFDALSPSEKREVIRKRILENKLKNRWRWRLTRGYRAIYIVLKKRYSELKRLFYIWGWTWSFLRAPLIRRKLEVGRIKWRFHRRCVGFVVDAEEVESIEGKFMLVSRLKSKWEWVRVKRGRYKSIYSRSSNHNIGLKFLLHYWPKALVLGIKNIIYKILDSIYSLKLFILDRIITSYNKIAYSNIYSNRIVTIQSNFYFHLFLTISYNILINGFYLLTLLVIYINFGYNIKLIIEIINLIIYLYINNQ